LAVIIIVGFINGFLFNSSEKENNNLKIRAIIITVNVDTTKKKKNVSCSYNLYILDMPINVLNILTSTQLVI